MGRAGAVELAEVGPHDDLRSRNPVGVSRPNWPRNPQHGEASQAAEETWPGEVWHEAGPTGSGLHRDLTAAGIDCIVVAPSFVPMKAGEWVKTNRREAVKLARFLRSGEHIARMRLWLRTPPGAIGVPRRSAWTCELNADLTKIVHDGNAWPACSASM